MAISVGEIFNKCGLETAGAVKWGDQIPLDVPGVYVVASTPDLGDPIGLMPNYLHDPRALAALRSRCPSVTIDGRPASDEELATRIGAFWIPDSAVLYLGLAGTSVQKRVNQYYGTRIGQRSPHAGGWWLKTMSGLETLSVHYAAAEDPKSKEALMLTTFARAVPASLRNALHDSTRIAPFANVAVHQGLRKRHGLAGYKIQRPNSGLSNPASRSGYDTVTPTLPDPAGHTTTLADGSGTADFVRIESQVITDADRTRSNLRIPARSKFALPASDGFLTVRYQGQIIEARWRVNGSRSGTIGMGKAVMMMLGRPNRGVWLRVIGTSVTIET